jgi:hypothetical protein
MAKAHMAFGQTIIYKTLHRKLKIEKHGHISQKSLKGKNNFLFFYFNRFILKAGVCCHVMSTRIINQR